MRQKLVETGGSDDAEFPQLFENTFQTETQHERYGVAGALHWIFVSFLEGGNVSLQRSARSVRALLLVFLTIISLAGAFGPVAGLAQDGFDRKVKNKVPPSYPEIARKIGLTGTVKLQVVVAPNGSVKETKVIGGHPILVTAAVDAVKKWKFDTASGDSTGTIEFRFDPGN